MWHLRGIQAKLKIVKISSMFNSQKSVELSNENKHNIRALLNWALNK